VGRLESMLFSKTKERFGGRLVSQEEKIKEEMLRR
jgi:hypothetical protein